MGSETLRELPIVDLSNENLTQGSSSWRSTCNLVRCALESYGCFVAVYEIVSSELHEKMFSLTKEIFELRVEIKVKNTSDYLGFGYGSNFAVMPLIEYLGITHGATLEATRDFSHLLWPGGNENFCETTFSYSKQLSELDHVVMRMAWSNGRVYAPLHQVTIDGSEERYRIGLFSFMRETLQVPEELVDDDNPLQFKPFNNLEFLDFCAGRLNVQRSIKDLCGV